MLAPLMFFSKSKKQLSPFAILLLFLWPFLDSNFIKLSVSGWPKGAPDSVCASMSPDETKHNAIAQTTSSPYEIKVDPDTVKKGGEVKVTIEGNGKTFKGFMVEVRNGNGDPIGKWVKINNSPMQVKTCSDVNGVDAVATHTSNDIKPSVVLQWKAPVEEGTFKVYYTVVESKQIYWAKVEGKTIKVEGEMEMTSNKKSNSSPSLLSGNMRLLLIITATMYCSFH